MIGIPVFAGFASKLLFGQAAIETENLKILIPVMLALAVSSLLNAIYFIRTMIRIYSTGTVVKRNEVPVRAHHRAGYNIPMIVLTVLNLILGLFSWKVVELIHLGLSMFR